MRNHRSEGAELYVKNFMYWHNQGLLIPEIAEKYGIGHNTAYLYLQEIADLNGVSRDSLLERVYKSRTEVQSHNTRSKVNPVDPDGMLRCIEALKSLIDSLEKSINNATKE